MPTLYIDKQGSVDQACRRMEAAPWAAVDTEADSFHHYREKLCLLQVSIPEDDYVFDPLGPVDLTALIKTLSKKHLILHGADFDVRILNRFYGFAPRDVFDTMVAAQLLGYEKQGLADLAERHCGVILPKTNQKADWSQRPLDESMVTYAANDTYHLKTISDNMTAELAALGRLDWHAQCCERVIQSATSVKENKKEPGLEWQVKGSKELKPKALTILKQLWIWREEEARRRDVPSFKVIHSETLVQMAGWCAEHQGQDVALLPQAPRNIKKQYQQLLNDIVRNAQTMPPTPYAQAKSSKKSVWLDAPGKQKALLLKEAREKIAKELSMQPSLLATNAALDAIVSERPTNTEQLTQAGPLMPWQAELLADSFLQILNSK